MDPRQIILSAVKAKTSFWLALGIALAASPAHATISQTPLLLGGGSVPGNLALVPSVEFPTVISVANVSNTYTHTDNYAGYFDSEKCYQYIEQEVNHVVFGTIPGNQGGGYFTPIRFARDCTGTNEWSGNYLNWATTQTIDPFRKALTGGYRVVDTTTQTILEKATRGSRDQYFDNRSVTGNDLIKKIAPYTSGTLSSSIYGKSNSSNVADNIKNYQRNKALAITNGNNTKYYSVRVEVCKNTSLLEENCVRYGNNWKPEGLLQRYANEIKYSAFSYLNIDGNGRDGGVLRAQQKYIGPTLAISDTTNSAREWNPDTGVFVTNPEGNSIGNSGVINYINKFGELTNVHKSNDPVSELYYTALRYFKNQGNVATYSNITDDAQRDKFPVITNWANPISYACQKNVILGIGDVNSHEDRDLPPTGDTLDIVAYTQKVFDLEGISKNAGKANVFNGNGNSAYIAGLAYYANTTDLRNDLPGDQTITTYWVDVREGRNLRSKNNNQYWLAAKYGGFKVPNNFGNALTRAGAIPESWWYTTNDRLALGIDGNGGTEKRPDNFFVASDANNMVEGLRKAFAQISEEVKSTTASLASNSTRLETDTAVFQSLLDNRFWSGDLIARRILESGEVQEAAWQAASKLDAVSDYTTRKIFTITPAATTGDGPYIATQGQPFTWAGLSTAQKALLQRSTGDSAATAQNRLNYLRGDRSLEITTDIRTRPFRQRGSRLGDIVNSDPQFIHNQDFGYSRLTWGTNGAVGAAYSTFRDSNAYKARTPLVIVGANDGMLHGFDARVSDTATANGGDELFAYVPNSVFANLIDLTDPAYTHKYYVDGTPRVSDVYIGGSWKTMVVGTNGAGGKSVFALDITDPSNMSADSVMWEFTHPAMGYTMGQAALVALPNEKFGVIVSSGYHNTAPTDGKVWVLDAADGTIIKEFTLPTTGNLGQPLATDTNYDMVADRIYVADTLGKVWRIDMDSATPSAWGRPSSLNGNPLFTATRNNVAQAITAPLSSAFNAKGQHMVFFGTGSFYKIGDNEIPATNRPVDTFYGIIDNGQAISGRANLLEQSIIKEDTVNGIDVRAISQNTISNDHKGWYLDLAWLTGDDATGAQGERVVSKATLRSDRVIYTTMTPSSDPCKAGGTSFIMAMDLSSGGRLNYAYFDTDGDNAVDEDDTTTIGDEDNIPWSGISEGDTGVVKGVTPLFKWLCFAGSSGNTPECIPVSGSQRFGRHSWREVRDN